MIGAERVAYVTSAELAAARAVECAITTKGTDLVAVITGHSHEEQERLTSCCAGQKHYLAFDAPDTLRFLREHATQLAAIVVDPVQFGAPNWRIREFLVECQAIAVAANCLLIFDETLAGFRVASITAQAHGGVSPDLSVFGDGLAGGLSFAFVAGRGEWMDRCAWPAACIHPIVLSRCFHTLQFCAANKQELAELPSRTESYVQKINRAFRTIRAPFKAACYSSLYQLTCTQEEPLASLLTAYLLDRGLATRQNIGMLTATHIPALLEQIIGLYRDAAAAMRRDGLLGPVGAPIQPGIDRIDELGIHSLPPRDGAKLGRDVDGNPVWFVTQAGSSNLVQVGE
jgi:glutamate-1-semialdehyde aminotransferase